MQKLFQTLDASTVLQAVLTIIIWGTICYLYASHQTPPDDLLHAGAIILGFYFGSQAQIAINKAVSRSKDGG
jgi:hypothetical protein